MNYYPFHLGDYAAHTAHLTPIEDIAYRRCLDLYYLREEFLPADPVEIARLIRMREHLDAVEAVLREFFDQSADGWHHARCDAEIASFRRMAEGGRKGAATRWGKGGDSPPMAPPSPPQANPNANQNQNQNQEPIKEKAPRKRAAPPPDLNRPDDVAEQVWADWLDLRRKKRAPVTATVLEGARAEAGKAGISFDAFLRIWCVRGSQGLQAEWIKPAEIQQARRPPAESFRERDARLAAERMAAFAPGVAARPVTESFIDVEASYVPALKGN